MVGAWTNFTSMIHVFWVKPSILPTNNEPARKHKAQVHEHSTDEEPDNIGGSALHGQNEDVVGLEEAEIAKEAQPDKKVASAAHQAENVV